MKGRGHPGRVRGNGCPRLRCAGQRAFRWAWSPGPGRIRWCVVGSTRACRSREWAGQYGKHGRRWVNGVSSGANSAPRPSRLRGHRHGTNDGGASFILGGGNGFGRLCVAVRPGDPNQARGGIALSESGFGQNPRCRLRCGRAAPRPLRVTCWPDCRAEFRASVSRASHSVAASLEHPVARRISCSSRPSRTVSLGLNSTSRPGESIRPCPHRTAPEPDAPRIHPCRESPGNRGHGATTAGR